MTLRERVEIQQLIATDEDARAMYMELMSRGPDGCVMFINALLLILEPRETEALWSDVPYLLRDFQESTVRAVVEHVLSGKSLLIDKTREMGVTWLVLAVFLWFWIYNPSFVGIVSSITEKKIDNKDDPSCLLWKFDYLYRSLLHSAPWLYAPAYDTDKGTYVTHMKRKNPRSSAVITGEAMTENLGRSGRATAMLLDEFAEAPYPAGAYQSSARTCPARIIVFTPKGMNFAGRLANPRHESERSIARISLHWMMDHTKNEWEYRDEKGKVLDSGHGECPPEIQGKHGALPKYPWYEAACAGLGYDPVSIAQELDIDYSKSVQGLMYPQIGRSRIMRLEYDPALALYTCTDYGIDDHTFIAWVQWNPYDRRFKWIDCFAARGKTIQWYVPFYTGRDLALGMAEGGYSRFELQRIERATRYFGRYTDHYGDPAGKARNNVTNTSVINVLASHGLHIRTSNKFNGYETRRFALSCVLPYSDFDDRYCVDLVQALKDSKLNDLGKPVHGPESHGRTAAEFFAVNQPHGLRGDGGTDVTNMLRQIAMDTGVADMEEMAFTHPQQVVREITRQLTLQEKMDKMLRESGSQSRRGSIGRRR